MTESDQEPDLNCKMERTGPLMLIASVLCFFLVSTNSLAETRTEESFPESIWAKTVSCIEKKELGVTQTTGPCDGFSPKATYSIGESVFGDNFEFRIGFISATEYPEGMDSRWVKMRPGQITCVLTESKSSLEKIDGNFSLSLGESVYWLYVEDCELSGPDTKQTSFESRVADFLSRNREFVQISPNEFVSPNANFPAIYDKNSDVNSFWKIDLFPGQPDRAFIVETDCSDNTWSVAAPDPQGTMRYVIWAQPITDAHPAYVKIFCETDYTIQSNIWLCKKRQALQMEKEPSNEEWRAVNAECAR